MGFFGLLALLVSKTALASVAPPSRMETLRLGIRYVVYLPTREPLPPAETSNAKLQELFKGINAIWSSCGIAFVPQLVVAEADRSPRQNRAPAALDELFKIRHELKQDGSMLIAVTQPWNRADSLGKTGANAWTAMPGTEDHGIIVEWPERWNSNLLAHELGHYLGLDHREKRSELMAPVIYRDSTGLSSEECTAARHTASAYWKKMIRNSTQIAG